MARSSAETAALRQGIAVGVSAAAYGISYGALAVAAGLDVWQTSVMSLVMFTGGSQFALVGVLATGGTAAGASAISAAAILGIRNGIYGIRMAPIIGGGRWRRFAAAWVTIDESTAVAVTQPDRRSQVVGFWVTAAATFVGWNITSVIGALIGNALGDKVDDLVAQPLFEIDAHMRMRRQERAQRLRQEFGERVGVGQHPNLTGEPAGIGP